MSEVSEVLTSILYRFSEQYSLMCDIANCIGSVLVVRIKLFACKDKKFSTIHVLQRNGVGTVRSDLNAGARRGERAVAQ